MARLTRTNGSSPGRQTEYNIQNKALQPPEELQYQSPKGDCPILITADEAARQLAMLRSRLEHCDFSEFPVIRGQIQMMKYVLSGHKENPS